MSDLVGKIVSNYLFKVPIEKVEVKKIKTIKTGVDQKTKTAQKEVNPWEN